VFCPPDERRGDAAVRSTGPHTHVHVLVTNGELIPTLCKLLLFGLHPFFHPDNIFSSREVGKHACFAEVARRFGSARRIIALGDSKEEEGAARTANFDFVRVSGPADVRAVLDMLAA
jgi:FMN phosphatase YigB (HAD superfamily)